MSVRRIVIITSICILVTGGLLWVARAGKPAEKRPIRLMAHAGAGIRPALDELGARYERKTGIKIEYNYKGSGCLLADVCASQKGDVYIPGEIFYMQQAVDRKLVARYRVVTSLTTVLIVRAGNPKKIKEVTDLARPGMRVGIGDPQVVACGCAAREVFTKAGVWEKVQKNTAMAGQNVTEVSNAVKLGHIDAAIVWDATAALYNSKEMMAIQIPSRWRVVAAVPAGAMKFSHYPAEAEKFVSFLASDEAAKVFAEHGFSTPVSAKQRGTVIEGSKS